MKKVIIVLCCFLGVAILFLVSRGISGLKQSATMRQRIEDVRSLTLAYRESTNANDIEDVIKILAHNGVRLNNPIAKDPSKPCYRVVGQRSNLSETNQLLPIIEETNVTDTRLIVVSYPDGSVVARKR
jgi:hypothetical protein